MTGTTGKSTAAKKPDSTAKDDHPSRRETVIDAALDMADRLVTTQYEFLRSVVHSADRSLRKSDDSHK